MSASLIVNLILALSPTLVNRQRALFKDLKFTFCLSRYGFYIFSFCQRLQRDISSGVQTGCSVLVL